MTAADAATKNNDMSQYFYRASAADLKKIPGSPVVYWLEKSVVELFQRYHTLADHADGRVGLMTSDNKRFLRFYWEVSCNAICFNAENDQQGILSKKTWFPHNKGGNFRKWAGNYEYIVDWFNGGQRIKQTVLQKYPYLNGNVNFVVHDEGFYFKPFISWSEITSGKPSFRSFPNGFTSNVKGMSAFPSNNATFEQLLALLNSSFTKKIASAINPTLSFGINNLYSIPSVFIDKRFARQIVTPLISSAKRDWDSYETSWDFTQLPLLVSEHSQDTLEQTYRTLRQHWQETTQEMQRLEEENNRAFIKAYGLEDELTPDVPLEEITLTCNPYYRYGGNKTDEELEAELLADTMREFVSYAVGCMFGRYSLDKPGLILANQGDTIADYVRIVSSGKGEVGSKNTTSTHSALPTSHFSFMPDKDNVIPLLDDDWFTDDITLRFREFLKVTFGEAHYEENLAFIESALNVKNKRQYSLRDFFLKEFYDNHVRRYKKRPIYWLFSSPKGSFNALIYLHRYNADTVGVVLQYLRDYQTKLKTEKGHQEQRVADPATSQGDKTRAQNEVDRLAKVLNELADYERDVVYPLATQQLEIDLDDGVKANYPKFGAALRKIPRLSA